MKKETIKSLFEDIYGKMESGVLLNNNNPFSKETLRTYKATHSVLKKFKKEESPKLVSSKLIFGTANLFTKYGQNGLYLDQKISNQPTSKHINDGLKLSKAYITTALKCVPPGDKPLKKELDNCFNFFNKEIGNLRNLKAVIALGKIAFDACVYYYKSNYAFHEKIKFGHGKIFKVPDNVLLIGCYHPSPRNVNTGRINEKKMTNLFLKVLKLV